MAEQQVNHWKTKKGKETLYNVFSSLVELVEIRVRKYGYGIQFWDIVSRLHRNGHNYKNAYVTHALIELIRLGFVRRTKYMYFFITDKGWEFWRKRKAVK